MSYIWLVAAVFFGIVEALTMGINFIWFSAGSLAAMIAALCGAKMPLQIVVFIVVTAVALIFTRPFVKKYVSSKTVATNADRIINKEAVVLTEIDNQLARGEIRVDGQIWSAKSESGEVIPAGETVKVLSISGVKAVVSK